MSTWTTRTRITTVHCSQTYNANGYPSSHHPLIHIESRGPPATCRIVPSYDRKSHWPKHSQTHPLSCPPPSHPRDIWTLDRIMSTTTMSGKDLEANDGAIDAGPKLIPSRRPHLRLPFTCHLLLGTRPTLRRRGSAPCLPLCFLPPIFTTQWTQPARSTSRPNTNSYILHNTELLNTLCHIYPIFITSWLQGK